MMGAFAIDNAHDLRDAWAALIRARTAPGFAPDVLAEMKRNDQVLFKYCDAAGRIDDSTNPNGAIENIAGICNHTRNVFGMMPHPERASEGVLGNADGRKLFESLLNLVPA